MTVVDKPVVDIDEWFIIVDPRSGEGHVLFGAVTNHPRIEAGHRVVTSPILSRQKEIVETHNTVYRLGKPHRLYELWSRGMAVTLAHCGEYK